jgi:hypothetical protein
LNPASVNTVSTALGLCADRLSNQHGGRFTPAILPPHARRSRSLEALIPILYLKGIATGDFAEALAARRGKDAPGLSASTIVRLKEVWRDEHEHEHWRKRDLSARRYVPGATSQCTACGLWDTGLKPAPPERAVEAVAGDSQPG